MGVTVTAETSVVRFILFHPTNTNIDGGNRNEDNLVFSNGLHIAVIVTLNTFMGNEFGIGCACCR